VFLIRVLPEGDLDLSFGEGGRLIFNESSGKQKCNCMAIQDDREIVFVSTEVGGVEDDKVIIRRILDNGKPDSSFGSNGEVYAGKIYISSILTLKSGKLLFAGSRNGKLMFTRYLENGEA
jgi:hypothetical protein